MPPQVAGNYTPEEAETLKCSTLSSRCGRISCRISLKQENELNYLPEECRALDGGKRESCKVFYSSVQSCWLPESQANPVACVRSQLSLGKNISEQVKACGGNSSCISEVAEKVHQLNKFRLYNLEWKAEYLAEEEGTGISHELLVDLVDKLEQKKLEYNGAAALKEKKQVLVDAKKIWQSFVKKVKGKVDA